MNEKMNVIWTKDKLHKIFSKETMTLASGDGASPNRSCRLCSGENSLRYLRDTYVWEGVEERYDQLLHDCFGVQVSRSDCMICEWCVRQLRNTERFRALVHAAFDQPPSSSYISQSKHTIKPPQNKNASSINSKEIIQLLKTKMTTDGSKRGLQKRRKLIMGSNIEQKRLNLQCAVCKHKYPMLVPFEGWKNFVCSRCKKNNVVKTSVCKKCNVVMASSLMKDHIDLHAKANLRGKTRLCAVPKKPSQTKYPDCNPRCPQTKYKCKHCAKKYAQFENLIEHVKIAHGENTNTVCTICMKEFKTPVLLRKHMRTHLSQRGYNQRNDSLKKRCDTGIPLKVLNSSST
ncbi:uncharacterized protein ACR2FA_010819 [Aphomia sociella]